jgi:hypothetical protein
MLDMVIAVKVGRNCVSLPWKSSAMLPRISALLGSADFAFNQQASS